MSKARPLKGLAGAARGQVAKGARKAVPLGKNVPRARNLDIPNAKAPPKPNASNQKLRNIVDDLWKHANRPGSVGNGTTFDALRNEILTGRPSSGMFHKKKSVAAMNGLHRLLNGSRGDSPLTGKDRQIAEDLMQKFYDALGKGRG